MQNEKTLVLPIALGRSKIMLPYLSLGMVTAYARQFNRTKLNSEYRIRRLLPAGYLTRPPRLVYKRVAECAKSPICLFSSYVWNHDLNLEVASRIREISPDAIIIFGGPHVPKYEGETEAFLRESPFIDIAVLGEGEATFTDILAAIRTPKEKRGAEAPDNRRVYFDALNNVPGIVFSHQAQITRTPARSRFRDIEALPSPYLTGEFEPWFHQFSGAVLETNRGCPYACTYCDWGSATLEKVTKFTTERVIAEIEYIAQKESESIFIADANFGMLEQDIEVARAMVEIKQRTGFPQRLFTNFAKNGGRRLMAVIKILHEGGLLPVGIIALQTTDPDVLKTIARDNIKTRSYEKMMEYFNSENIPMASDLMIGLPGQTIESFANDLQFCFDWKVTAAANYTSMMPNAPMAEKRYREEHMIATDENNMIQSTATFSPADMDYMKKLYTAYLFHVKFGILKYILYFLQLEHGVPAIKFLRRWLDCASDGDASLPVSARVVTDIFAQSSHTDWAILTWGDNANFLFDNIEVYYAELLDFAQREFDIQLGDSELLTLINAQQAVVPREQRPYPYTVELPHDFSGYIAQLKGASSVNSLYSALTRLSDFAAGNLTVSPEVTSVEATAKVVTTHAESWELPSPLRFY